MMAQEGTASYRTRALGVLGDWLESRRHQAITTLLLYAGVAIGYLGLHVLPHLGSVCVCMPHATDPSIFIWSLAWWPHALLHGVNPFLTNAVFAPDPVDIWGATTVPGAALTLAPVTLLFGPIVSYDLLMLASPVLAAFFAFLLCRYITQSFAPSVVSGYLFGFSAYMFGQLLGHLHLVLIFPIPAAVHLTLGLIDGRIADRRDIVLMALTIASLLLFSTEVALVSLLLGAAAFVLAVVLAPAARSRLIAAVKPILLAGAGAAVVTSPVIYYAFIGNVTASTQGLGDLFGGDALGFLVSSAGNSLKKS